MPTAWRSALVARSHPLTPVVGLRGLRFTREVFDECRPSFRPNMLVPAFPASQGKARIAHAVEMNPVDFDPGRNLLPCAWTKDRDHAHRFFPELSVNGTLKARFERRARQYGMREPGDKWGKMWCRPTGLGERLTVGGSRLQTARRLLPPKYRLSTIRWMPLLPLTTWVTRRSPAKLSSV